MEKRRSGMGITDNFFLKFNSKIKPKLFFETQLFWGCKKSNLNPFVYKYVLGFVNNFSVFNFEYSLEFLRRSIIFCFRLYLSRYKLTFASLNYNYRHMVSFFAIRCLQVCFYEKWVHGFLTKNRLLLTPLLIVPTLDKNLIAETYKNFVPLLCIQDNNLRVIQIPYLSFGNEASKKSVFFFYKVLTEGLLKLILFTHCKNRILHV